MKVSIITINFNNRIGLECTIKSVLTQISTNYEFIIVDGGSTDGSLKTIQKYKESIDSYVSEKDSGPFDAMNKGIERASGKYCIFMNSGDSFFDDSVINEFIAQEPAEDILSGIAAEHMGKSVVTWYPASEDEFCLGWFYRHTLSHQATFIKTSLLKNVKYDTEFHIVSDWLFFMVTLLNRHATYRPLDFYVCNYMDGGISRNEEKSFEEREKAIIKYYGERILRDCHFMYYGKDEWDRVAKMVDFHSKVGKMIFFITKFLLKLRKR